MTRFLGDIPVRGDGWGYVLGPVASTPSPLGERNGYTLWLAADEAYAWKERRFGVPAGVARLPEDPDFAWARLGKDERSWLPPMAGECGAIVDFLGIDSLVGGKARHFSDAVSRMVGWHLLGRPSGEFHRFGVAGLGAPGPHPGGEVIEWNLIRAGSCEGFSRSHAGCLIGDVDASNRWMVEAGFEVDARSDYSQTLWSRVAGEADSRTLRFRLDPRREASLLDGVGRLARALGLEAYGARIRIERGAGSSGECRVAGRVLKRAPILGWKTVKDASDSAIERHISLQSGEEVLALGTYYPRNEPSWESLTGGRRYEARGHFHATLISPEKPPGGHRLKTFHLRDAFLAPGDSATIELLPATRAFRVHRVLLDRGRLIIASSGDPLTEEMNEWV